MDDKQQLGSKSRKAFVWDLLGSMVRQGTTVIITIILARLLGPEEFGLIGIALVFITLSQVFIDVGFTDGLIQKKDATSIVYSSIFYLNLGISLVLVVMIFFAAPFIGNFYDRPQLPDILRWLILVIPIAAIGKVHETQLRKDLNFKSLTIRSVVAANVGGAAGIFAAYKGWGVYSLVIQQLLTASFGSVLLWVSTGWRPLLRFSWPEVKSLFAFSGYIFLDQGMRQLFQRLDVLFIGKVFSPVIVGFYTRAESLNFQITAYTANTIRKVMFPVLSAVQDDEERFNRIYFKVFAMLATASAGLAGVLFFCAHDLILLLLGKKWEPTVVLFQILVFKTILSPFGVLMGKSMLSRGHSKEKFMNSMIQRVVMLSPLVVAFFTDITGFAFAVVIAYFLGFLINAWLVHRVLRLSFVRQVLLLLKPLVPLFITIPVIYFSPVAISSAVQAVIFVFFYFGFLFLTGDDGFRNVIAEAKNILSKRKNKIEAKTIGHS